MKIILISHNMFGVNCLDEILNNGGNVTAVWTIDKSLSTNISDYAEFEDITQKCRVPLYESKKIDDTAIAKIQELNPDIIFVFGWSQLLPNELLNIPPKGCIGMHPTLLPRGRGRAAIPWALIKGLDKTGLTMFYLSEGADTGDIIGQKEIAIEFEDNAESLYNKVISAGRNLISEHLPKFENDTAPRIKQDDKKATLWPKRRPDDGLIDWNKSPIEIYNWIRGLSHPYPGAFSYYKNKKIYIYSAKYVDNLSNVESGTIIEVSEQGLLVSAWEYAILINKIQPEDDKILTAIDFANKYNVEIGDKFQNRFKQIVEDSK